jgi:hypothetical protein
MAQPWMFMMMMIMMNHQTMKTYGVGEVKFHLFFTEFYSVYAWKVRGGVELSIHKVLLLTLDEIT